MGHVGVAFGAVVEAIPVGFGEVWEGHGRERSGESPALHTRRERVALRPTERS